MEKEVKGTYVKVQFSNHIRQILDKLVSNGIAHHLSLVYGDFQRPFEIFAHLQQWHLIQ
jgi:L-fucose isomerase-like protein